MTSPAKSDRCHPGSARGLDTCRAILDHQTPARRRAETPGSIQEQVGRRLAAGDHRRTEQVILPKTIQEAGQLEADWAVF